MKNLFGKSVAIASMGLCLTAQAETVSSSTAQDLSEKILADGLNSNECVVGGLSTREMVTVTAGFVNEQLSLDLLVYPLEVNDGDRIIIEKAPSTSLFMDTNLDGVLDSVYGVLAIRFQGEQLAQLYQKIVENLLDGCTTKDAFYKSIEDRGYRVEY